MEKLGKFTAMQTYTDLCNKVKSAPKTQKYLKNAIQTPDSFVNVSDKKTLKTFFKKIFK